MEGTRAFGAGVLDIKGGLVVGLFALEAENGALGKMPLDGTLLFNGDGLIRSPSARQDRVA